VFFAALCGIFYDPTQRHRDHRENRASVFSAALCGIFYDPAQRHRDHRENRASVFFAALCGIFYDPTQRHRDHREKQSLRVLCGFVWDIGLRPSPESVIPGQYRSAMSLFPLCQTKKGSARIVPILFYQAKLRFYQSKLRRACKDNQDYIR